MWCVFLNRRLSTLCSSFTRDLQLIKCPSSGALVEDLHSQPDAVSSNLPHFLCRRVLPDGRTRYLEVAVESERKKNQDVV